MWIHEKTFVLGRRNHDSCLLLSKNYEVTGVPCVSGHDFSSLNPSPRSRGLSFLNMIPGVTTYEVTVRHVLELRCREGLVVPRCMVMQVKTHRERLNCRWLCELIRKKREWSVIARRRTGVLFKANCADRAHHCSVRISTFFCKNWSIMRFSDTTFLYQTLLMAWGYFIPANQHFWRLKEIFCLPINPFCIAYYAF